MPPRLEEIIKLRLQFGERTLGQLHLDIGFHLSHDAADVLTSVDRACILADGNIAAASSGDAADIVAHVLITDNRPVFAGTDGARVVARNAAGIIG